MITTVRYAHKTVIDIAKELAKKKNELYVARKKKTIRKLAWLARKLGEEEIKIIGHKKSRVLKINELGEWAWSFQ